MSVDSGVSAMRQVMPETSPKIRIVEAISPTVIGATIRFGVHFKTMRAFFEDGHRAPIGQYVGLMYQQKVLTKPTAIFQGIRRPFIADGADDGVYAYVSKPYWTFTYAARHQFSGEGPDQEKAPTDSVFVTFVTLDPVVIREVQDTLGATDEIGGVILHWEWTMASTSEPWLPREHQARYRRTIWAPT